MPVRAWGDEAEDEDEVELGFGLGKDAAEDILRKAGYLVAGTENEKKNEKEKAQVREGRVAAVKKKGVSKKGLRLEEVAWTRGKEVSVTDVLDFERKGHVAVKGLLASEEARALFPVVESVFRSQLLEAYRQKVGVLFSEDAAERVMSIEKAELMLSDGGYKLPFLQAFNLHRVDERIARFVKSERLACVAARLLGAKRVRLYQDSLFFKRPGDQPTPFHSDLHTAPIDTNNFVTFWFPLRAIPASATAPALCFASGSHRDFAAAYWFSIRGNTDLDLSSRYDEESHGALALGDATAHHGWTLHMSPGVPENSRGRMAISVSFFADEIPGERKHMASRVLPRPQQRQLDNEDRRSYEPWLRSVKSGKRLKHEMLPIVYDETCDDTMKQ